MTKSEGISTFRILDMILPNWLLDRLTVLPVAPAYETVTLTPLSTEYKLHFPLKFIE